jgi:hypothetical protein
MKTAHEELYELIASNPELVKLQAHISRAMDEADPEDPLARLNILMFYIKDNLEQLTTELLLLNNMITNKDKP